MTFDPQALYDATRPHLDQLELECEVLRRDPYYPHMVEARAARAVIDAINQTTDLGFLLQRIRREQER